MRLTQPGMGRLQSLIHKALEKVLQFFEVKL